MAKPVATEIRERVIQAVADGASAREAARQVGINGSTAATIVRETRAVVDYGQLRENVTAIAAQSLTEIGRAILAHAQLAQDEDWLREHADLAFGVAQASRVWVDQWMRLLAAWQPKDDGGQAGTPGREPSG